MGGDVSPATRTPLSQWLSWPVRVALGDGSTNRATGTEATFSLRSWGRPATLVSSAIPLVMMVLGLVGAVLASVWAEQPDREGLGTLGVEAGAALWFGGAVAFGARRSTTVLRAALLVATALAGAILIVVALAWGWSGAALSLAMEFGVGAIAVLVIDVVLLGRLHPAVEQLAADAASAVVTVQFARSWPVLEVRVERGEDSSAPRVASQPEQ